MEVVMLVRLPVLTVMDVVLSVVIDEVVVSVIDEELVSVSEIVVLSAQMLHVVSHMWAAWQSGQNSILHICSRPSSVMDLQVSKQSAYVKHLVSVLTVLVAVELSVVIVSV